MKNKIHLISKNKGFTLIELLVVVSIIAVLASIIFNNIKVSRFKALDTRKKSELRAVSIDLMLYRETYGTNPSNKTPGFPYSDMQPNFLSELITANLLPPFFHAPTYGSPYYYYDYGPGNSIGMLVATQLSENIPNSNGLPESCRPWPAGTNMCSQGINAWYCLCNPY